MSNLETIRIRPGTDITARITGVFVNKKGTITPKGTQIKADHTVYSMRMDGIEGYTSFVLPGLSPREDLVEDVVVWVQGYKANTNSQAKAGSNHRLEQISNVIDASLTPIGIVIDGKFVANEDVLVLDA